VLIGCYVKAVVVEVELAVCIRIRWCGGLIGCLYEGCSGGVLICCYVKAVVVEVELAVCIRLRW
jgi:hypothetical protein